MQPLPGAGVILRYLCLLTALANMGGNIALQLAWPFVFELLKVPDPVDGRLFLLESALSFTMGVVALLAFLNTPAAIPLMIVGALGKATYAIVTYWNWAFHGTHWFYLIFAGWDVAFTIVFLLYWIHLQSRDLLELRQSIFDGLAKPVSSHALVIGFSLTENGRKAVAALRQGLESRGYTCDVVWVESQEKVFHFPMSLIDFVRIIVRALLRMQARIAPLDVPRDDYDLVVVESPTWLLSMAAPVEAVFRDARYRRLFAGRDAVALSVSRGAFQRTQTMIVRWLERLGANVVAARGYGHLGWEPRRLMSLWFYLIFRREGFPPGLVEPKYGLSDETLASVRNFGADLAQRSRTRQHWTLLEEPARAAAVAAGAR